MGPNPDDAAIIDHNDLIGFLHRADALGDDQDRRILEVLAKGCADLCLCSRIHSACAVVQDQDVWLLEESACDTQALLLTARHIDAALPEVGVIPIRKAHDKVVGLGIPGSFLDLLLRRSCISPHQVLTDGAGEEDVLLKHDTDRAAQGRKFVVADVNVCLLYTSPSPRD